MKRAKGTAQTRGRASRRAGVSELDLRALLDHLGRLLAQEYAALLTQTRPESRKRPRLERTFDEDRDLCPLLLGQPAAREH